MGNRYTAKQKGVTPGSGVDILSIQASVNRRARLIQVSVAGNGTTSAYQMIEVGRATAGSSLATTIVPGKFDHTDEPAPSATYGTTWGTAPTLSTTDSEVIGWNALGGANRWIPPKGAGFEFRNGEVITFRASVGVTFQAMSLSVVVEED